MFFLALAAMLHIQEAAPKVLGVFDSKAACYAAAAELAKDNQEMLERYREAGAAFICLELVKP